jgi:ABC-type glycerol-3-phosphate transport system permease component
MDGCSNRRFIMSVALPLCRAAVAVIALFYAVQHWNAFFDAIMYLTDSRLHPLQIVLRNILIRDELDHTLTFDVELEEAREYIAALLKYSLIVVSTVPVLIAYPFAQKHFVKGLLVGSLKG